MLNVLIRRVLIAIPVLIVVASLTFFFIRLAPGGPFDADKVAVSYTHLTLPTSVPV